MRPRKRAQNAVETARALLQLAGIEEPEDLDIDALAAACDAYVMSGHLPHEDGRRLRAGAATIIRVREGMTAERALFTKAHELAHLFLHALVDQLLRCTQGGAGGAGEDRYEREADDFTSELTMPRAPMLARIAKDEAGAPLSFEAVSAIASWRRMSLQATGIRVAELTKHAVAMVHVTNGRIDWAAESHACLGKLAKGNRVGPGTVAARLTKEAVGGVVRESMSGLAWGMFGEVIEESVRTDYGSVIAWVRKAPRKASARAIGE